MAAATVCAACPPESLEEVSQICNSHHIRKAFTQKASEGDPECAVAQWESRILMAVVGSVEEQNSQSARILCIGGRENHLQEPAAQDRVLQAIRVVLARPSFQINVDFVSLSAFREEFASSGADNNRSDNGFWQGTSGNLANQWVPGRPRTQSMNPHRQGQGGKGHKGSRHRSVQARRNQSVQPRRDDLQVVWMCGECQEYYQTYELLADHQQSTGHWNATLNDYGRRFVSEQELKALVINRKPTDSTSGGQLPQGVDCFDMSEDTPANSNAQASSEAKFFDMGDGLPNDRQQSVFEPAAPVASMIQKSPAATMLESDGHGAPSPEGESWRSVAEGSQRIRAPRYSQRSPGPQHHKGSKGGGKNASLGKSRNDGPIGAPRAVERQPNIGKGYEGASKGYEVASLGKSGRGKGDDGGFVAGPSGAQPAETDSRSALPAPTFKRGQRSPTRRTGKGQRSPTRGKGAYQPQQQPIASRDAVAPTGRTWVSQRWSDL